MPEYGIDDIQKLLDCKGGGLTVPRIEIYTDIQEFMAEHYKGDLGDLRKRLSAETQQCQHIINILKEELDLKMCTLNKLKKDIMTLRAELIKPDGGLRYLVNREMIQLDYMDELECKESDIHEALSWLITNMSKLGCNILSLINDVRYMMYLKGASEVNIERMEMDINTVIGSWTT